MKPTGRLQILVKNALDSSLLARATSVVRDRRAIFDQLHIQSRRLQCGDRVFATRARSFDTYFNFFNAKFHRFFRGLLGSTLTRERSTLATPFEAGRSCARPTQRVTFCVGNRHRRIVESCLHMGDSNGHVATYSSLLRLSHLEQLLFVHVSRVRQPLDLTNVDP